MLFFCFVSGVVHNSIKMAMPNDHRKLLTDNRVALVKDMHIDEELLSCLRTNNIVTSDMKEEIEVSENVSSFVKSFVMLKKKVRLDCWRMCHIARFC